MAKLVCSTCGQEKDIPTCCTKSMIVREGLLCCCSDECHHHQIPKCCGIEMNYI